MFRLGTIFRSLAGSSPALARFRASGVYGVRHIRYGKNPNQDNWESVMMLPPKVLPEKDYEIEVSSFSARIGNVIPVDALRVALTHQTHESEKDGDRLSFLGRNLSRLLVGEFLFRKYPNMPYPQLEAVQEELLSQTNVGSYGRHIGLQHVVRSNRAITGRESYIVVDSFFSLVAAFVEHGSPQAARDFLLPFVESQLVDVDLEEVLKFYHPKFMLKHLLHKKKQGPLRSVLLKESGRATHAPVFVVGLYNGTVFMAEGAGVSLKNAEREAARTALRTMFLDEMRSEPMPPQDLYMQEDLYQWTVAKKK
eukprot:Sdes_comp10006_c0_seq1m1589